MHGHGFKPELQGLRAVAVLLVLLFHLEFGFVGGGYVGVDAFFVLSGYLITGSLVAEVERTGRIGLAAFYERRFRRLLPAATLVLAAILVFIAAFPRDQWPSIAREVAAASVYLENLLLAYYSVDYLAFDRVASPVQHYWSLSVEEQFYLFWPLFLVGAVSLGRRLGWLARRSCLAAILLALLLSLAWSVAAARAPRPGDYFYTHLRVWELALGGLVACAAASTARLATGRLAAPIQWTGLALLIGASVFYSAKTVFPGSAALVPVIGTALVIMVAAQGSPTRRNGLLDNPAMRWIGDISYSVYLWHWPIVIALKNRSGGVLGPWDALTAFLLTLILSQLTKVFVEDRFRVGGRASVRTLPVRRIGVFVVIAVAIALPLLASATVLAAIAYDRHRFQTATLDPRDYPGAGILLPGSTAPLPTRPFFPPTHLVGLDIPKVYANECSLPYGASTIRSCPSGTPDSPVTVAVVGDSHAAQWLPAFEVAGAKRGWRILPLTKSSCPLAAIRLTHPDAEACEAWTRNALAILTAHPPAVIVYTLYLDGEIAQLPSDEARMAAVRPMLNRLAGLGARVIVLRDTPHLAADPIAALEADATQPTILPFVPRPDDQDALARAAADLPGVSVLDLNAFICPNGQCFTAIGNVVVWRDRHHITARYAETLAPLLAERLAPSVTAGHARNE